MYIRIKHISNIITFIHLHHNRYHFAVPVLGPRPIFKHNDRCDLHSDPTTAVQYQECKPRKAT